MWHLQKLLCQTPWPCVVFCLIWKRWEAPETPCVAKGGEELGLESKGLVGHEWRNPVGTGNDGQGRQSSCGAGRQAVLRGPGQVSKMCAPRHIYTEKVELDQCFPMSIVAYKMILGGL